MSKQNSAAREVWMQLFATMAKAEDATLVDPEYDAAEGEFQFRKGLAQAGWSETEIELRVRLHNEQMDAAPVTSPGVNPHVEFMFSRLCDDIEAAMDRLGLDSHARLARGIEPRAGPRATMTNVVMTDESIITVGSF